MLEWVKKPISNQQGSMMLLVQMESIAGIRRAFPMEISCNGISISAISRIFRALSKAAIASV